MIPPVVGRETIFGWYPPAHEQFAKVPYKTMAVLDDYSHFKTDSKGENSTDKKMEIYSTFECESTVLSSKLNAIRQDLTRRRIDPTVIRQCRSKKYESVNQYMNIPTNWRPKYPEPHFEMIRNLETSHSAPIEREIKVPIIEMRQMSNMDKQNEIQIDKGQSENPQSPSVNISNNKEIQTKTKMKSKFQRPHSAPGSYLTTQKSPSIQSTSVRNRQISADGIATDKSSNIDLKFNGRKMCRSQSCSPAAKYEADLAKYKWMMEIPGDPFEIKQPHIPEKQAYFQKIEDVKILPPELRMTKQNRDTFFYNTQPPQAMSFDISPNFTSERYNAMKNQLRNQGKWNYSSKTFAFVY